MTRLIMILSVPAGKAWLPALGHAVTGYGVFKDSSTFRDARISSWWI